MASLEEAREDLLHEELVECQGCGTMLTEEELFDDVCEWCWHLMDSDSEAEQPPFGDHLEWTFVRDERL